MTYIIYIIPNTYYLASINDAWINNELLKSMQNAKFPQSYKGRSSICEEKILKKGYVFTSPFVEYI